jgi:hypothetical protein
MGTRKMLIALALAGVWAVLALPDLASAAPSGVTIHLTQGRFHGFVFSPRRSCHTRTVKLIKQKGRHRNLKRDRVMAKTTSFLSARQSGKYKWIVDKRVPRPPRPGKYYARVSAIRSCQADNSKTIHVR